MRRAAQTEDEAYDEMRAREDDEARDLAAKGAQAAADHADRTCGEPLWSKLAWVRALQYLALRGANATFTTEALRAWAEERSTPPPPDARAWGNVTGKLLDKKLITDTEKRVRSANKRAHGREVVLWRVCRG